METIDLGSANLHCHIQDHVMTQAMYRGIKRAAILADDNSQVDILLITGSEDVFAVGGDMSGAADGEYLNQELDATDHFPFRHLERCSKAVIAAVNGLCYAGGLNLLLYSDISIASNRAKFRAPELIRGVGKVVPHDNFEIEVQSTIEAVLRNGPKNRAMIKADMNCHLPAPDPNIFKQAIRSPELKKGMTAFLEKRPAVWPRD